MRSKSANRIQRYFCALVPLDNHEPEFLFCKMGLIPLPPVPPHESILVMLSPLEDDLLIITKNKKQKKQEQTIMYIRYDFNFIYKKSE